MSRSERVGHPRIICYVSVGFDILGIIQRGFSGKHYFIYAVRDVALNESYVPIIVKQLISKAFASVIPIYVTSSHKVVEQRRHLMIVIKCKSVSQRVHPVV